MKSQSSIRKSRSLWTAAILVAALPATCCVLWLVSGHELFTKSGKAINVPVQDIFGETQVQKQFAPGPIAGYYIGLDLVLVTLFIALFVGAALLFASWLSGRRRPGPNAGRPAHEL